MTHPRLLGIAAGAVCGFLFTSFGLIEARDGFHFGGGNEWTPLVTGGGIVAGAVLGSTRWFSRHALVFLGAAGGLATGIWIRDNGSDFEPLQPPLVFVALFGPAVVLAAAGAVLDRRRRPQ